MTRRTQRDWLQAGIEIITAEGRDGLKLEALCGHLGVTRGSFYHHFRDLADYRSQLLEFYRRECTLQIIEVVDREAATPRLRLERLLALIVELSSAPEQNPEPAIRAWALQDAEVRDAQKAIDARRVEYVEQLLAQMGAEPARARLLSEFLYALLVGCEQMHPPVHGGRLRAVFDEFLTLIGHSLDLEAP
jgi:AcrR family transcriptional regulator